MSPEQIDPVGPGDRCTGRHLRAGSDAVAPARGQPAVSRHGIPGVQPAHEPVAPVGTTTRVGPHTGTRPPRTDDGQGPRRPAGEPPGIDRAAQAATPSVGPGGCSRRAGGRLPGGGARGGTPRATAGVPPRGGSLVGGRARPGPTDTDDVLVLTSQLGPDRGRQARTGGAGQRSHAERSGPVRFEPAAFRAGKLVRATDPNLARVAGGNRPPGAPRRGARRRTPTRPRRWDGLIYELLAGHPPANPYEPVASINERVNAVLQQVLEATRFLRHGGALPEAFRLAQAGELHVPAKAKEGVSVGGKRTARDCCQRGVDPADRSAAGGGGGSRGRASAPC